MVLWALTPIEDNQARAQTEIRSTGREDQQQPHTNKTIRKEIRAVERERGSLREKEKRKGEKGKKRREGRDTGSYE